MAMPMIARSEPPRPDGATELLTCLVVGPIGNRHAEVGSTARESYESSLETFEQVIRPACAALGIEPLRSERIQRAGEITELICRHVLRSDIVIADVTGGDADVMYELGLRHTTGRLTIHIGEHGRLPFDVSPIRTILFERSRSGLAAARKELQKAVDRGLQEGCSPLTPARILLGLRSREDVAAPERAEGDAEDPPGLTDRFAAVEAEMDLMTQGIESMTGLVTTIAALAEEFGPEMERSIAKGSQPSAALAVARRFATALDRPAAELRACAADVASRMPGIDSTVHASLDVFDTAPQLSEGTEARDFLLQLIGMSRAAREGLETLRLFRMTMEWLTTTSRDLRAPGRDIISALDLLTETMSRVETWDRRANSLV